MKQFLTLTVWWAIPVIWLPVVVWCISMSVSMGHSLPEIVAMVVFGVFLWTFIEYILHRFLFHMKTTSYWFVSLLHFIYLIVIVLSMNQLYPDSVSDPNIIVEPFQGKHCTLSSSRIPSQAPNGPPSTRLSSSCNSDFMCFCMHSNHPQHYPTIIYIFGTHKP